MDNSPSVSSVYGIFQARILEYTHCAALLRLGTGLFLRANAADKHCRQQGSLCALSWGCSRRWGPVNSLGQVTWQLETH